MTMPPGLGPDDLNFYPSETPQPIPEDVVVAAVNEHIRGILEDIRRIPDPSPRVVMMASISHQQRCDECGVMVVDAWTHDQWHESLNEKWLAVAELLEKLAVSHTRDRL